MHARSHREGIETTTFADRVGWGAPIAVLVVLVLSGVPTTVLHGLPNSAVSAIPSAGPSGGHGISPAAAGHLASPSPLFGPAGAPFPSTGRCSGFWSTVTGQAGYPAGCYGHDEPSMAFYSDLPGSGGNVTWKFTLPVGTSATANQSSLYATAWFGIALAAPRAWLHQCFVELQFYPDSSWYPPYRANGEWTVAAVGWQVDVASHAEDTCVAAPMTLNGGAAGAMLNLSAGDSVTVSMRGWSGASTGENFTVLDRNTGNSSTLILADSGTGAPLVPIAAASGDPGAIAWSPSANPSVAMGFEIGRSSAAPSNNTFHGCNPGPPPSTAANPSVPCPSYDPTSWTNDTSIPWEVSAPTFSTRSASWTPSAVAFSSTVGGSAWIAAGSNKTCAYRAGSAFCSYPWFSYSCNLAAFEFGATDFVGVTSDFGQYGQYTSAGSTNVLGDPVYWPQYRAIPACGHGDSVTLGRSGTGTGSLRLLGQSTGTVSGLTPGRYPISASPNGTSGFGGWTVGGSVSVADAAASTTTAIVAGNGSLSATFVAAPMTAPVWFNTTGALGATVVTPGLLYADNNSTSQSVASGSSIALASGVYTVQAAPPPGYLFQGWTVGGTASLASVGASFTTLNVDASGTAQVTARLVPAPASESVVFGGVGNGTVTLDGVTAPYTAATESSTQTVSRAPGSYSIQAVASPGWTFLAWRAAPSAVQTDTSANSTATIEKGPATITALFAAAVKLLSVLPTSGRISVNATTPAPNGTVVALLPGVYSLDAVPSSGFQLKSWSVSDPTHLFVYRTTAPSTRVQVNSTGTITATYQAKTLVNVTFNSTPAAGGTIEFNFVNNYTGTQVNSTLTNGTYVVKALPSYGYGFLRWVTTGPVSITAGLLKVNGSGGIVEARFIQKVFPVTFADSPASSLSLQLNGTSVANGATLNLVRGVYTLGAVVQPNTTFSGWSSSIPLTNLSGLNATLNVGEPGSVTALAVPFAVAALSVSPGSTDVSVGAKFTVQTTGLGPFSYSYLGLPPGCPSRNAANLTCTPSAPGVYNVSARIVGYAGAVLTTPAPAVLTVHKRPQLVGFNASSRTVDVGQSLQLSTSVAYGTAPLAYLYVGLPTGCAGANASLLTCTPNSTGSFRTNVTVTDAVGVSVTGSLTVNVGQPFALTSFTVSPTPDTAFVPVAFRAAISGGSSPFSYSYTSSAPIPGCTLRNAPSFTCVPTSNGTFTVSLRVTDSAGAQASGSVTLGVNAAPLVTLSISPASVAIGATLTVSASARGGTGNLSYVYTGLPGGCPSKNASSFTCDPIQTGSFNVAVVVTDTLGANASSAATVSVVTSTPAGGNGPAGAGYLWVVVLAIAVVALLAGVSYAIYRRRSARDGRAPPTPRSSPPYSETTSPSETTNWREE